MNCPICQKNLNRHSNHSDQCLWCGILFAFGMWEENGKGKFGHRWIFENMIFKQGEEKALIRAFKLRSFI